MSDPTNTGAAGSTPPPFPLTDKGDLQIREAHTPVTANDAAATHHRRIDAAAAEFHRVILEHTPPGRAQSVAVTNLETAAMWANKAIAQGQR